MEVKRFVIENWEPSHARWSELSTIMKMEEQDYYWRQADRWSQFEHRFLIAIQRDEIAGFLEFYLQPMGPDRDCPALELKGESLEEAKIIAFAVLEQYRRQGIGRELQIAAIRSARDLNCFQLRSFSSNQPGHRANHQLKLSMGFAAQPELREGGKSGVNFIMPLLTGTAIGIGANANFVATGDGPVLRISCVVRKNLTGHFPRANPSGVTPAVPMTRFSAPIPYARRSEWLSGYARKP